MHANYENLIITQENPSFKLYQDIENAIKRKDAHLVRELSTEITKLWIEQSKQLIKAI